ncbi:isochorismatase family protein [Vibrio sp. D431a]|uniref:isochorismatase family protein n=1 Tax=Vibrio sp. D431a TaxID=2837388 RepID=UPI00255365C4|nr:isochorismatase family protein [Vibrio sp. D431a]MDK9790174.1 isochorismatase family protein [Vibrio sp. D431a]
MKRTIASVDVDPQKGFTKVAGELVVVDGELIVPELLANQEISQIKVVTRDWHPPAPIWEAKTLDEQFTPIEGRNVDIKWNMHCGAGTFGSELLDELPSPIDYDFCVSKGLDRDVHPYGALYHDLGNQKSTGLKEFLQVNGVTTVIVGGLATDHCVYNTVKQLVDAGFEVFLNLAACRGVAADTTNFAIEDMRKMAMVFDCAEEIKAFLS